MKAEINEDGIMMITCENDKESQDIKAWILLNNGRTLIPEKRKDYATTKLNNLNVIIIANIE
jgi:hypothetical protein